MGVKKLSANVTPQFTDRAGLQGQVDEQVAVLYSTTATMDEKEVALYNYDVLRGYWSTLFGDLPAVNV